MSDPSKPTDADVEHLRRAMVEAWQTCDALAAASSRYAVNVPLDVAERRAETFRAAAQAFVAADSARGGL